MRSLFIAAALSLPFLSAPTTVGAQEAPSMADRLRNDPRVEALRPYGLNLPPAIRNDKGVQFGKAMRVPLDGHPDFWRIGVTTPLLKPVKKGDRIVIAFWARAEQTEQGAPGKIGRVQLEATPVVRAIFEQSFEVGPTWKMYQLKGVSDRDYNAGDLNAALQIDSAKQVLDFGPVFVLDYGVSSQ